MDNNVSGMDSLKNRDAFTKPDLTVGMPSGVFMFGLLIVFGSYFLLKLFIAPIVLGVIYYSLMFRIHKDDSRALSVWLACWSDDTSGWLSGAINDIEIKILNKGE